MFSVYFFFFFSSRRRHTRFDCDWSSDVCSSDLLGIDAAMGSRGALVIRRHDAVPFNREQILLADILATLMAIQIERALRASDARRASDRIQEECDTATRHLHETTLELQAINAVAAAPTPSLDLDRQIEISLPN